jgi:hypothetical protein
LIWNNAYGSFGILYHWQSPSSVFNAFAGGTIIRKSIQCMFLK